MAINLTTNSTFINRHTPADANYPQGSAKDETAPAAGDGSPYVKVRADDIFGLQQALLKAASIVPTGNADTALASQYMQAIVELASGRAVTYDDVGVADAYVLDVRTNQQAPDSLFDGLIAVFPPLNTNGGASTVNVAGFGVKNIVDLGGNPLGADVLVAGNRVELVFELGADRFVHLNPPLFAGVPVAAVTALDRFLHSDASDGDALKTDTIQGILDLVPGPNIISASASNTPTIEFTVGLGRVYMLFMDNVAPTLDNNALRLRTSTDGGSTFDSGATDYASAPFSLNPTGLNTTEGSSPDQDHIALSAAVSSAESLGNAANETYSGSLIIYSPSSPSFTRVTYEYIHADDTGFTQYVSGRGGGWRASAADVDTIQLSMADGTIATGEFTLIELIT